MPVSIAPEISAVYVLTSASGIRCVFNNRADADYVGDVSEVSGFDGAEIREEYEPRPRGSGGLHGQFLTGRRPLTLSGKALNPASTQNRLDRLSTLRSAVADCLLADGRLTWTLSSGVELAVNVRTQQPLRISGAWQKDFQIAMVAEDPNIYSADERVAYAARAEETTNPDANLSNNAPSGLPAKQMFPAMFPWWNGLPDQSQVVFTTTTVSNAGDTPTPARILLRGGFTGPSGSDLYVLNSATNDLFVVDTAMGVTDVLLIDTGQTTITQNGQNIYDRVTLDADWFWLPPGESKIAVYGSTAGAVPSSTSISVTWHDAWR